MLLEFLDEQAALHKVAKLVLKASKIQIAVAFWGHGASKLLGLQNKKEDVEIICNLDSGACNPAEIRALKSLYTVRSDPRLHGKVYLVDDTVIVGSSNASTNGLAVEGQRSGWSEANIITDHPAIVNSARAWFRDRRKAARLVKDLDIEIAEKVWNERLKMRPTGRPLTQDLGAAFRSDPSHPAWKTVKVAIYTDTEFSDEGSAELTAERERKADLRDPHIDAYENWHDELDAGDWIIDLPVEDDKANVTGYWQVLTPKYETKLLTFLRKSPSVSLPAFGRLKLSNADKQRLKKLASALLKKNGLDEESRMVSFSEAIDAIDNS